MKRVREWTRKEDGEINRVVARNLRRILKEKHLKQQDVAHIAGLHPQTVGNAVRAYRGVSLACAARIAQALGVGLGELTEAHDETQGGA